MVKNPFAKKETAFTRRITTDKMSTKDSPTPTATVKEPTPKKTFSETISDVAPKTKGQQIILAAEETRQREGRLVTEVPRDVLDASRLKGQAQQQQFARDTVFSQTLQRVSEEERPEIERAIDPERELPTETTVSLFRSGPTVTQTVEQETIPLPEFGLARLQTEPLTVAREVAPLGLTGALLVGGLGGTKVLGPLVIKRALEIPRAVVETPASLVSLAQDPLGVSVSTATSIFEDPTRLIPIIGAGKVIGVGAKGIRGSLIGQPKFKVTRFKPPKGFKGTPLSKTFPKPGAEFKLIARPPGSRIRLTGKITKGLEILDLATPDGTTGFTTLKIGTGMRLRLSGIRRTAIPRSTQGGFKLLKRPTTSSIRFTSKVSSGIGLLDDVKSRPSLVKQITQPQFKGLTRISRPRPGIDISPRITGGIRSLERFTIGKGDLLKALKEPQFSPLKIRSTRTSGIKFTPEVRGGLRFLEGVERAVRKPKPTTPFKLLDIRRPSGPSVTTFKPSNIKPIKSGATGLLLKRPKLQSRIKITPEISKGFQLLEKPSRVKITSGQLSKQFKTRITSPKLETFKLGFETKSTVFNKQLQKQRGKQVTRTRIAPELARVRQPTTRFLSPLRQRRITKPTTTTHFDFKQTSKQTNKQFSEFTQRSFQDTTPTSDFGSDTDIVQGFDETTKTIQRFDTTFPGLGRNLRLKFPDPRGFDKQFSIPKTPTTRTARFFLCLTAITRGITAFKAPKMTLASAGQLRPVVVKRPRRKRKKKKTRRRKR